MADYKGIPFNGGLAAPTGTGAQHIVQTIQAVIDYLQGCFTPGRLTTAGGDIVLDWQDRQMFTLTAVKTVDWENAALYTYLDGSLAMDWGNRHLIDSGGTIAIDWQNRQMNDITGTGVFNFYNGIAFFNAGPVPQQPGGAATAGPTYGSTEQNMLNALYLAMQAYGLLT